MLVRPQIDSTHVFRQPGRSINRQMKVLKDLLSLCVFEYSQKSSGTVTLRVWLWTNETLRR
jgi:hypothetical protein